MIELRPGDTRYPALLGAIPAPPPLFVRGEMVDDDALALAIVGSRRPTPYGLAVAERLAADLAERGVTIVSGLARGIDTASHRGALAAGGRTIAVLGCGLDVVYPLENRALARAIEAQGALVSQFAPGVPALPGPLPREEPHAGGPGARRRRRRGRRPERRFDHRRIRRRSRPRSLRRSWPNHVADERRRTSPHPGRC